MPLLDPNGLRSTYQATAFRVFLPSQKVMDPFLQSSHCMAATGCVERWVQSASDRLVSWGYVALLVDSFTTRSIDHACTPEKYATRLE
jgi:hypothetical protein